MFNSSAQNQKTWQWAKQLGGPTWNVCSGVAITSKNDLYVSGSFSTYLISGNKKVLSHGGSDIFLARFDTKGKLCDLWSYGGKGFDQAGCIASGANNAIILGGSIGDSATFGKQKAAGAGTRLFVSSTDSKGYVSWVSTLGTEGNASLFLITTGADGTIYAAGIFSGSLSYNGKKVTSLGLKDIFVLRLTSSGVIEQLISFGSNDEDNVGSLSVNQKGDLTLAGSFTKSLAIGKISINACKGKANLFVAKFNKTLEPKWAKVLCAEDYGIVSSLRNDELNNLYVAGNFNMKLSLPDTSFISRGFTDAFVVKYDTAGSRIWGKQIGSAYYDYITGLTPDHAGGIITTGSIGDTTQIDSVHITLPARGDAAFVAQLSSDGKALWGDIISGTGRNFSTGSVLDKNGNLYLCGSFKQSFKRNGEEMKSQGDQDVFLARYYNCPEIKMDFIGDPVICPRTNTRLSIRNNYKTIIWNDTLKNTTYLEAKAPGLYHVSIVDKKGCRYTDTIQVTLAPRPFFTLGKDTTVSVVDSVILKAPSIYREYLWMNGTNAPSYLATATDFKPCTQSYWITFTDQLNCHWYDTIAIRFVEVPDLSDFMHVKLTSYPNPVTDNLTWKLTTDKTCRLTIEVADNYGHLVYTENIDYYSEGMERQIPMSKLPAGTYMVRIKNSSTSKVYDSSAIIKR